MVIPIQVSKWPKKLLSLLFVLFCFSANNLFGSNGEDDEGEVQTFATVQDVNSTPMKDSDNPELKVSEKKDKKEEVLLGIKKPDVVPGVGRAKKRGRGDKKKLELSAVDEVKKTAAGKVKKEGAQPKGAKREPKTGKKVGAKKSKDQKKKKRERRRRRRRKGKNRKRRSRGVRKPGQVVPGSAKGKKVGANKEVKKQQKAGLRKELKETKKELKQLEADYRKALAAAGGKGPAQVRTIVGLKTARFKSTPEKKPGKQPGKQSAKRQEKKKKKELKLGKMHDTLTIKDKKPDKKLGEKKPGDKKPGAKKKKDKGEKKKGEKKKDRKKGKKEVEKEKDAREDREEAASETEVAEVKVEVAEAKEQEKEIEKEVQKTEADVVTEKPSRVEVKAEKVKEKEIEQVKEQVKEEQEEEDKEASLVEEKRSHVTEVKTQSPEQKEEETQEVEAPAAEEESSQAVEVEEPVEQEPAEPEVAAKKAPEVTVKPVTPGPTPGAIRGVDSKPLTRAEKQALRKRTR